MSPTDRAPELRAAAFAAMAHAYAPYSRFRVGAALETDSGVIVSACNVENAAFPLGICAEQAVVAAAVALGSHRFTGLAIATEGGPPSPPCGACRQVLAEFGDLPITSYSTDGRSAQWSLSELLPQPFSAARLPENPR
ncbi:MAG TPA: cytidine deaminase [Gemmatimonadaceae bacterium]|nr:cytidine deaminase [Gemmatimonadaceae bacterium]